MQKDACTSQRRLATRRSSRRTPPVPVPPESHYCLSHAPTLLGLKRISKNLLGTGGVSLWAQRGLWSFSPTSRAHAKQCEHQPRKPTQRNTKSQRKKRSNKKGREEGRRENEDAGERPPSRPCPLGPPLRRTRPSRGGGIRTRVLRGCRVGGSPGACQLVVLLEHRRAPARPAAHAPHRRRHPRQPRPSAHALLGNRGVRPPIGRRLRVRSAGQRGPGPGSGRGSMPPSPDLPGTRSSGSRPRNFIDLFLISWMQDGEGAGRESWRTESGRARRGPDTPEEAGGGGSREAT